MKDPARKGGRRWNGNHESTLVYCRQCTNLLLTYPNDGKVGEVVTPARSFIIVLLHKVATISRPCPIAFIPGLVPKGTLGTSALLHRLKEERQRSEIPHHLKM